MDNTKFLVIIRDYRVSVQFVTVLLEKNVKIQEVAKNKNKIQG